MKNLFLTTTLCAALGLMTTASATTYYTRVGGSLIANIWGSTTTGAPGAYPNLVDDDVLYVDDNVTVNGNISINARITLFVDASMVFTGKLNLKAGSLIYLVSSAGKIISNGSGNSDHLNIGGVRAWDGKDPDRTGPGAFGPTWQAGILPVKLSYFTAVDNQQTVHLSWATTSEEHFQKFIVERSGEGAVFEEVGEVAGRGFDIHDIESDYIFEDDAPLAGYNYYRLKAIDLDGTFEYFGVKAVQVNARKKLAVYPNPTSGQSISFDANFDSETGHVTLIDQFGEEIFNGPVSAHQHSIVFPTPLRAGMYILRYRSEGFEQTERLVVKPEGL